jgi:hypothetical protein
MSVPDQLQDFVSQKVRNGKTVAINLSPDEHAALNAILQWRKQKGISNDMAGMLRQMVHFVSNKEYLQFYDFALPTLEELNNLLTPSTPHHEPDTSAAASE